MNATLISKIAIAGSVVAMLFVAPVKAQEHGASTGVVQSEVRGDKKEQARLPEKEPLTEKQHPGAQLATGKDLKGPTAVY